MNVDDAGHRLRAQPFETLPDGALDFLLLSLEVKNQLWSTVSVAPRSFCAFLAGP
jgi:hypothetical protein